MTHLRPALVLLALMSLLTGIAYPLAVTGVAQTLFPWLANGSLVVRDGVVVGSALIGQPFAGAQWFWSRPSATSPVAYDAAASSGSNLGPLSPALLDGVQARIDALGGAGPVPVDLVTASGSGLDPHVTPAGAAYQIDRVARARGLDRAVVARLVAAHTRGRQLGVLGEPRVDVLGLNLALAALPAR